MYFAFLVPAFGAGPVQWSFGFGAPEAGKFDRFATRKT
jgi:hypothetical protein